LGNKEITQKKPPSAPNYIESIKRPIPTSTTIDPNHNIHQNDIIGSSYYDGSDIKWSHHWQPVSSPSGGPNHRPIYGTPVVTYPPPHESLETHEDFEDNNNIGTTMNSLATLPVGTTGSREESMTEPVTTRICHVVPNNNNSSGERIDCVEKPPTSNEIQSQRPEFGNHVLIGPPRRPTLDDSDPVYDDNDINLSEDDNNISSNNEHSIDFKYSTKINSPRPTLHSAPAFTHNKGPHPSNTSGFHQVNSENSISLYRPADPDVVLPPQLQFILNQLESQGLGPNSKGHHRHPISHSPSNKYRRLIPSSRSLKPRPVMLSNHRRQSKALDVPSLQMPQISKPNMQMHARVPVRQHHLAPIRRRGRQRNLDHRPPMSNVRQPVPANSENAKSVNNNTPSSPMGFSNGGHQPPNMDSTQRSFTASGRGNVASIVNHYPTHLSTANNQNNPPQPPAQQNSHGHRTNFNDKLETGSSNDRKLSSGAQQSFVTMKPNGFFVIPVYSYDASRTNQMPIRQGVISRRVLPPPPMSLPHQQHQHSTIQQQHHSTNHADNTNGRKMDNNEHPNTNNGNRNVQAHSTYNVGHHQDKSSSSVKLENLAKLNNSNNNGIGKLQQRSHNNGMQRRRNYFEAYEEFRSYSNGNVNLSRSV